MKIAWIGCGVMGRAMILHLLDENHELHAYNRTFEKTNTLPPSIHKHKTLIECIQGADVVFTMVSFPQDVEELYFGSGGILENAKKDAILIDMTTSSPALAQKIAQSARQPVLDAPVSGGDSGARAGTLSIMVGGDKPTYQRVLPLLERMGCNVHHIGPPGFGQHCKMCNQIAVAGATAAYSEALIYMEANQLDPHVVLATIQQGAGGSWQLHNMAPRVLQDDLEPGFFIKHFTKDMRIVSDVMKEHNITLEMLTSVHKMYISLEESGWRDKGTQSLFKYYKK